MNQNSTALRLGSTIAPGRGVCWVKRHRLLPMTRWRRLGHPCFKQRLAGRVLHGVNEHYFYLQEREWPTHRVQSIFVTAGAEDALITWRQAISPGSLV